MVSRERRTKTKVAIAAALALATISFSGAAATAAPHSANSTSTQPAGQTVRGGLEVALTIVPVFDGSGHEGRMIKEYGISRSQWPDGRDVMWVIGSDHAVWASWEVTDGGSWSGWHSFGGYATSEVYIFAGSTWRPQIEVYGYDGRTVYERHYIGGNGDPWTPWASCPHGSIC